MRYIADIEIVFEAKNEEEAETLLRRIEDKGLADFSEIESVEAHEPLSYSDEYA